MKDVIRMSLFGAPIETVYLYVLIIAGLLTVLYIFFGDFLEGIGEIFPFINPVLILAFITFFSAAGYILESTTTLSSLFIIGLSLVISLILDTLLNIFILIPLSTAEESLSYTEESLIGRVGKIIIPIPDEGYGEVVIESKSGMISKPATQYTTKGIHEGTQVLVLEVKNGVLYVEPYEDELEVYESD